MSADPYNSLVRELFGATDHAGCVGDGVVATVDEQGLRVQFSVSLEGGRLATMRFLAWGCPFVIAGAEYLCRYYEGEAPAALDIFPTDRIMDDLAVPAEKTGRILVLEDAIRSLGRGVNK